MPTSVYSQYACISSARKTLYSSAIKYRARFCLCRARPKKYCRAAGLLSFTFLATSTTAGCKLLWPFCQNTIHTWLLQVLCFFFTLAIHTAYCRSDARFLWKRIPEQCKSQVSHHARSQAACTCTNDWLALSNMLPAVKNNCDGLALCRMKSLVQLCTCSR